jgi:hypothetical protein
VVAQAVILQAVHQVPIQQPVVYHQMQAQAHLQHQTQVGPAGGEKAASSKAQAGSS